MRAAVYWITAVVAAVLQATFLAGWRPLGIVPGLALIAVIRAAVAGTASQALVAAVVAGLVLDLAAGDRFGFNTTFLVVTVLAVAQLRRGGTVFSGVLELAAVAVASLLRMILAAALMLGQAHLPLAALGGKVVLTALVNLAIAVVAYLPLSAIMRPVTEESSFAKA